ncbi:hypothetical protein ASU66_21625, partial [Enterobacter hormaechei subsp. xiangfangensis]|uniref:hypothetical protein n=1 Tax=Enterobacter hormaechei TaxID=158836 RepID=UPI000735104D
SVRHIFKPISYLEIQLLSGVSGGYINQLFFIIYFNKNNDNIMLIMKANLDTYSQMIMTTTNWF